LFTAALHAKRLQELRESYVQYQSALLLEASREKERISSGAKYYEEHLETINCQMLHDMQAWASAWKASHTHKIDEIRNDVGIITCI
jgi:hypothetical protein